MADRPYTILGNAEAYLTESERSRGGKESVPHRTLAEAQAALLPQLDRVERMVNAMPQAHRLDEVVIELRLDHSRMAKSYHPTDLLRAAGLTVRGAGTWKQTVVERAGRASPQTDEDDESAAGDLKEVVPSRMLLVSGNSNAIRRLRSVIGQSQLGERLEREIIGLEQVRVPTMEDHLAILPTQDPQVAVEIVLYAWDNDRRDAAVKLVRSLIEGVMVPDQPKEILVRPYVGGPTFIAAVVPQSAIPRLGELNYLRLTRTMPRVQLTRTAIGVPVPAPPAHPGPVAVPATAIAVFDGGVAPLPQFRGLVHYTELTKAPCPPDLLDHGTAVVSAAIYGDLDAGRPLPPPRCQVYAYRVMPDPRGSHLDLYGAIDAIEDTVPRLPRDVKVVSLSIGPLGPIDEVPSRFTYAVDRMSYDNDKLFITAVGNWGAEPDPAHRRMQAPSDAVNAIAVGAFTHDKESGQAIPAPYGSRGPGRAGGVDKPEVFGFGGCANFPFNALCGTPGVMKGTLGTSYPTPVLAALCGQIISGRRVTTQGGRALFIHGRRAAEHGTDRSLMLAPKTLEDVLGCTRTSVSVLYQGEFTPRSSWRLPFLMPPKARLKGNVTLTWTIAFACEVDHSAHDEYTLGGIEMQLRPNANCFNWSPPKGTIAKPIPLHVEHDRAQIQQLEDLGWTRSTNALPDSKKPMTERVLRAAEAKWETLLCGTRRKRGAGLEDPAVTVSFLGRAAWGGDHAAGLVPAPFGAVLTMQADTYDGDLYQEVAESYVELQALAIANQTVVPVAIGRPPTPPPNQNPKQKG